ncbi:hypothetical protein LCGC14_0318790 [marine sediment metagenome]|uniref:Uncharacterized protein n=1 Tax=marine sediment metagenome TaxID=412755 RepID=A0A0F9WS41_9ZZZZ
MICNLLRTIELLDELQYWIDNWTHCNTQKRYHAFGRVEDELIAREDYDSASIAGRARSMSIMLPFKGRETMGPNVVYSVPYLGSLKTVLVVP